MQQFPHHCGSRSVAVPMGQEEQVWVMMPPAVAGCKVGPSQCHSQATPLEVCVCCLCVFPKPWLSMALAPEMSPAPELSALGRAEPWTGTAGSWRPCSHAVQGLPCSVQEHSQELQFCFPAPAAAEKHSQQPRALAREPSLRSPACCEIAATACDPQEELVWFQEPQVSKGRLLALGPS